MPPVPPYYKSNAETNKSKPFDHNEVFDKLMNKLSIEEVKALIDKEKAEIIDLRDKEELRKCMLKYSIPL
jgi:hypothetical protein